MSASLPIEPLLPAIREKLTSSRALVLQAPPGAGKTTLVPLALLGAEWLHNRRIVMLEPRRLATRSAAARMATLHGDRLGETVGYRMRGDSRVSGQTRIEVVTEGVLTRRLQRDPTLDDVGLLIFDEFHERSLDADLGLALALRTRELVRDDLRIIIMSATLDGQAVARLLGDAPILTSEGRTFPVETRYVTPRADARIEATVVNAILDALRTTDGHILVFLPGAGEIRRVETSLADRDVGDAVVTPLFGALSPEQQDHALFGDGTSRRRIVLSTSIAETSLTIEGVRVVIDSGLSRTPRFSPATGMARLETVRVSRASADQRRGRAGRVAPGVCVRLWPEHEMHHLLAQSPPEIVNADLAPLALDLASAGVADPTELRWLDAPSPAAFAQARELLVELEAIDPTGTLTSRGEAMASVPTHPRLAHMLLRAQHAGALRVGAELAALLSERDVFRAFGSPIDADVALRIDAIRGSPVAPPGAEIDRDALRRVRTEADRLERQLRNQSSASNAGDSVSIGALLALAYPDRVAQRRPGELARYVLRNGRGAELVGAQMLSASTHLVAVQLDDRRPESRIFLAASIELSELRALFDEQIINESVVEFDVATEAVIARRRERLGAIVLREVDVANPSDEQIRDALLAAIRKRGIARLPFPDAARKLRERIAFVALHEPAWPSLSDAMLADRLDEWLAPALTGVRRLPQLDRVDLTSALFNLLDWKQRRALDELAPTHIEVPTGSRISVDYSNPEAPALAVRIQEVFGLSASPRVLGGRVLVTMELLSPAHRPVQVTRDLAGFWRTSYFDVRKDLRGRYPKHEWPEDPLNAKPTRRAKPRGT